MARPKLTETPEFKDAVSAAVAEQMEGILAKLTAARGDAPVAPAPEPVAGPGTFASSAPDERWAQGLALAISQLSDQGTGRGRRVAPDVLAARHDARDHMTKLIITARAESQVATYRLKGKVYLDEVLVDPMWVGPDHVARHTEIEWPGVPNQAMEPINDTAKGIFDAFCASIGSVPQVVEDGDLKVTARGLVVVGRPKARTQTGTDAADVGLKIVGRGQPGAVVETRVLGTVAAPARQTA